MYIRPKSTARMRSLPQDLTELTVSEEVSNICLRRYQPSRSNARAPEIAQQPPEMFAVDLRGSESIFTRDEEPSTVQNSLVMFEGFTIRMRLHRFQQTFVSSGWSRAPQYRATKITYITFFCFEFISILRNIAVALK